MLLAVQLWQLQLPERGGAVRGRARARCGGRGASLAPWRARCLCIITPEVCGGVCIRGLGETEARLLSWPGCLCMEKEL